MVGPAVRPKSPPVVPQTQSVRIFHKRGDEVVVVEEEDTPKEMRWLKSTLTGVIKQIEVSTKS